MKRAMLAVIVAVLLAGCPGVLGPGPDNPTEPAPTSTVTEVSTETATATATESEIATDTPSETPNPTPTPSPEIAFAVTDAENLSRARSHLEYAVQVWNQSAYVDTPLTVINNTEGADRVVTFTKTIGSCGDQTPSEGSATFGWCDYNDGTMTATNRFIPNQTRSYTTGVIGHSLGIEEPRETGLYTPVDDRQLKTPFVTHNVTVALTNRDGKVTATHRAALNQTLQYWNTTGQDYGDYQADWQLVRDKRSADVLVAMTDEIVDCSGTTDAVGCAPILTKDVAASYTQTVQIEAGWDENSTTRVMKHEFGHILGLDHGVAPTDVMAAQTAIQPKGDIQNLNTRNYAFEDTTLKLHVEYDELDPSKSELRPELIKAIEWYEAGSVEQLPDDLQFEFSDSYNESHIVVTKNGTVCGDRYGACTDPISIDTDNDDRPEYYLLADIYLNNAGEDDAAYWFAKALGVALTHSPEWDDAPPEGIDEYESDDWPDT